MPEHEEPAAEGFTSGEEEERPLPLPSDLDTARFGEIRDDFCTLVTTTPKISLLKRRDSEPGDTVRACRCVSGTGIVVCDNKESRRLALMKVEPEAEERACSDRVAETEAKAALKSAYRAACQSVRNPQRKDSQVERRKSGPYLSPATWTRPGLTK